MRGLASIAAILAGVLVIAPPSVASDDAAPFRIDDFWEPRAPSQGAARLVAVLRERFPPGTDLHDAVAFVESHRGTGFVRCTVHPQFENLYSCLYLRSYTRIPVGRESPCYVAQWSIGFRFDLQRRTLTTVGASATIQTPFAPPTCSEPGRPQS